MTSTNIDVNDERGTQTLFGATHGNARFLVLLATGGGVLTSQ